MEYLCDIPKKRDERATIVCCVESMENINIKVCAVIVTYNRKELLKRNLDSLLQQTASLGILIYDNASTDGTYDYLEKAGIIDRNNVEYFRSDKNTGGGGGFKYGAMMAVEKGYDYIWLMDDDGYCIDENTLSRLLEHTNDKERKILNSYVTCNLDTLESTFGLTNEIRDRKTLEEISKDGEIRGSGSPYNGTLIPRECFEEVGYNDERYFVYGDEQDYVHRTVDAGYEWITIMDSFYYHPVNWNILWEFKIGKYKFDCKRQPMWKFYLEMRNRVIMSEKYGGNNRYAAVIFFNVFIRSIFYEKDRIKRLKCGLLAIKDARNHYYDRDFFNIENIV